MKKKELSNSAPAEQKEITEVVENQINLPEGNGSLPGQPKPTKKSSTRTSKKKTPVENEQSEANSEEVVESTKEIVSETIDAEASEVKNIPDPPLTNEPSSQDHQNKQEHENIELAVGSEDKGIDLEEHIEDGEEEDFEDDQAEEVQDTIIDYDNLSRAELVELLEELVQNEDIDKIKKKAALIKVSFLKKGQTEKNKLLENYLIDKDDENQPTDVTVKDITEERFNTAFEVYREKRQTFNERLENQKRENLEKKQLILEELKALIESEESLKKTYDEFRNLQDKWREIGMVPKSELNNLWQSYHFLVERFFDKVKINKELRDLDLKKNLETKIEICEKAEELLLETSIHKAFKKLQQYHQQWKESGPVPQDKKDEIWERFKNTSDKINQRRREHYDVLKDEQSNNLLAKTTLCEKAEEVLQRENDSIKDWQENTNQVSELLKVWKTIGPAPRAQNDEIWERFKTLLDTFFAAKKEYFQAIKDEQMNNYNLKFELCTQAEAIQHSTDWRQTTQELIRLQNEWKYIGPAPKKHSDKIWKRFRAACDTFFKNKSEYFSNVKELEKENLKHREELIKKIESFEFEKDKNKNLELLKEFQREWTEIGHVPYKEKDRLQVAFRDAINKQLDKLKINKAEMQAISYRQRIEEIKEKPNSGRIINSEINFLQTKRKKMEDEVKLWENNIGFLANSKKADLLKEEFEKKITGMKNEIDLITEKIRLLENEAG